MKTFSLTVVSESKTLFSGQAVYCSVITPSGSMGFEANHESFLCTLQEDSTIHIRDVSSRETEVSVQSGLLSFKDNTCTVTVLL